MMMIKQEKIIGVLTHYDFKKPVGESEYLNNAHYRSLKSLYSYTLANTFNNIVFFNHELKVYQFDRIMDIFNYKDSKIPKYIIDFSFPKQELSHIYKKVKQSLVDDGHIFINPLTLSQYTSNKIDTMSILKLNGYDIIPTVLNNSKSRRYMTRLYPELVYKPNKSQESKGVLITRRDKYFKNIEHMTYNNGRKELKFAYHAKERGNIIQSMKDELGLSTKKYIIQPYISLLKNIVMLSFRVFTQRVTDDTFNIEIRIRYNHYDSVDFNHFIKHHPQLDFKKFYSYIVRESLKIHKIFENHLNNFIHELGIDFVIGDKFKLHCIEVNSKSGKSDKFWSTSQMQSIIKSMHGYIEFLETNIHYTIETINKPLNVTSSITTITKPIKKYTPQRYLYS